MYHPVYIRISTAETDKQLNMFFKYIFRQFIVNLPILRRFSRKIFNAQTRLRYVFDIV